MPDEILEGHFEGGGATLRFTDPALATIGELVTEIRALYARDGER